MSIRAIVDDGIPEFSAVLDLVAVRGSLPSARHRPVSFIALARTLNGEALTRLLSANSWFTTNLARVQPEPSIRPRQPRLAAFRGENWLLLLYLLTATPLAPLMVTLFAELDRDHQVELEQTAEGIQVALRHHHSSLPHQHGWVARTVTLFAQPTSSAHPDHFIQFGRVNASPRVAAPDVDTFESRGLRVAHAFDSSIVGPRLISFRATDVWRRPGVGELLLSLRSTILLI